jgi:ATP-dependent Clp protease ATP-binding subunit ClpA
MPVRVSAKILVGQIILVIRRDGVICTLLAKDGYDTDQGARSLKKAVESKIADQLVLQYLEEDGWIQDKQDSLTYVVDAARNGILSIYKKA